MADFGEKDENYAPPARVNYRITDMGEKLYGVSSSRIMVTQIPVRFAIVDWRPYYDEARVAERAIVGIEPALAEVDKYCNNLKDNYDKGVGVYLYSPTTGNGKSSLGGKVLIQSQHMKWHRGNGMLDYSAHYAIFQDVVDIFTSRNAPTGSIWNNLLRVDFLFLDEVCESEEKSNPNYRLCMETLLRKRSEDLMLPTIIASNYTPEDFRKVYGPKAAGFLNSDCKHICVEGESFRDEKGEMLNPSLALAEQLEAPIPAPEDY